MATTCCAGSRGATIRRSLCSIASTLTQSSHSSGSALLASGGALAATRLAGGQSAQTRGREVAVRAARETTRATACREIGDSSAGPALSPGAPLPAITGLLPSLDIAVRHSEQAATLEQLIRARVNAVLLSRTLRTIPVSAHVQLLVAVGIGEDGGESVRDPVACAHARLARAEQLDENDPPPVRRWARWRLAQMRDTVPGLQTLYVYELPVPLPPHEIAGGGTADPVRPGHPLKPGLLLVASEPGGSRLLIGIAARNASSIRLQSSDTAAFPGPPRLAPVKEGFYAVLVPRGIGQFKLLEVADNGQTLHLVDLRQ
jgi:hypothetical protein